MEDVLDRDAFGEENSARRGRSPSARTRRNSTPAREATSERRFNKLIVAMKSLMDVVQNQAATINTWFQKKEAPRRHVSPPSSIPDEEEEPREEDKMEKAPSLRRSHSLRDRGSTHHRSMSHQEHAFVASHSHRAPQGTNPILRRFLEEDVGKIGEQLVIPKPPKPMFTNKSTNEVKNWVLNPLQLNQIFREYSKLDTRLRRDMNFNGYLKIGGWRVVVLMAHTLKAIRGVKRGNYNKILTKCKFQCTMPRR